MPIKSTHSAINKTKFKNQDLLDGNPDTLLKSCLFKNNIELQNIYKGNGPLIGGFYKKSLHPESVDFSDDINNSNFQNVTKYEKVRYGGSKGEGVVQIKKALRVAIDAIIKRNDYYGTFVVGQFSGYLDSEIWNKNYSNDYDKQTEEFIKDFQSYMGIDDDGVVGKNTLKALDKILNEIKYYDCETGQIKHDASICEDIGFMTVAYKVKSNVHVLPDSNSDDVGVLDPNIPSSTKVFIIQDINNFNEHWLYVQIDLPFDNSPNAEPKNTFGYVRNYNIWTKSSMPDQNSSLIRIIQNEHTVYGIINDTYYRESGNTNQFGYELRTDTTLGYNVTEYNMFKFYVNLLIVANNEKRVDIGNPAIYINYPNHEEIDIDDINGINALDPSSSQNNYDYFLEQLETVNSDYDWASWTAQQTVVLRYDKYLWVPSREFADQLYGYLINNTSDIVTLNTSIRNSIIANWDRGYGVEIEGSLGATFGIPIHAEVGASVYLYRKYTQFNDEVVMVLKKQGRLQVNLDASVGAGFHVGSGKKSDDGKKLAAQIQLGAGVEAGAYLNVETEYEFEFWDPNDISNANRRDLGGLALFTSLIDVGVGTIEFAANQFVKAFSDYNIDPDNFLTSLDIKLKGFVQGSAAGVLGFKVGDSNDIDDLNNGVRDHQDTPWHIKKIMSYLNISLGLNVGATMAVGYKYTAEYDDASFDIKTGARVPSSFTQTLYTNSALLLSAGVNLSSLGLYGVDLSPYLQLELSLIYVRPSSSSDPFKPDPNNLVTKNNGTDPLLNLTTSIGDGNWQDYENSATEFGLNLESEYQNPFSLSDTKSQMNYIYFKRRVKLINLTSSPLRNTHKLLNSMRNFFNNSQYGNLGVGAGAFIDIEVRLKVADIAIYINEFDELLSEVRKNIAHVQGVSESSISWVQVLIELPKYWYSVKNSGLSKKFFHLLDELMNEVVVHNFSFHSELSFGGSIGLKIAAALKAALNAQAVLSLTYDQTYYDQGNLILPDDQIALVQRLGQILGDVDMIRNIIWFDN